MPSTFFLFVNLLLFIQKLIILRKQPIEISENRRVGDETPLAIHIENACFTWKDSDLNNIQHQEKNEKLFGLNDINLNIPQNSLTMIIGKFGAGKSTLLSSILSETFISSGRLEIYLPKIAYCSQEPWIINGTFRENVLFGKEYNEDLYNQVIDCCCLEDDLKLFPYRDATEIGEQGVNLSGGQKARIALARAVYSECDIYLLDDIFSAVDVHVAKAIFQKCLLGPLLASKTTVLVTHRIEFLYAADNIVIIGDTSDYTNVDGNGNHNDIEQYMGESKPQESTIVFHGNYEAFQNSKFNLITEQFAVAQQVEQLEQIDNQAQKRVEIIEDEKEDSIIINDEKEIGGNDEESGRLIIQPEQRITGKLKNIIFLSYFKNHPIICLFLNGIFLLQLFCSQPNPNIFFSQ